MFDFFPAGYASGLLNQLPCIPKEKFKVKQAWKVDLALSLRQIMCLLQNAGSRHAPCLPGSLGSPKHPQQAQRTVGTPSALADQHFCGIF